MEEPQILIENKPFDINELPKIDISTENYRRITNSPMNSPPNLPESNSQTTKILTDGNINLGLIDSPKLKIELSSIKKYEKIDKLAEDIDLIKNEKDIPEYKDLTKNEEIKLRIKFSKKFQDLRQKFPKFEIPKIELDNNISINELHINYFNWELELNSKGKTINTYRFYLVIFFLLMHLIIKALNMKINNFINYQLMFMGVYDELIKEYIDEDKVVKSVPYIFDKKTPIEYRFFFFLLANTVMIFITGFLENNFQLNKEYSHKIINFTNSMFLTGESPIDALSKVPPVDTVGEVVNALGINQLSALFNMMQGNSKPEEKLYSSK
jgi:hypothetical protein